MTDQLATDGQITDAPPAEPEVRSRLAGWRVAAFGSGALLCWLWVLGVHGFLPGMSQVPLTAFFGSGAIECLHDQGVKSLGSWCMSLGLPIGAPPISGLPHVYLGWLLSYLPGADAWWAHQVSQGLFDTAAFAGGYLLMRRWGVARWIALPAVVAYMTAPNVLILNGFPYTFMGFLLLPAFLLITLWSLDAIGSGRWLRGTLLAIGVSVFMVFTDGYAFFSAALLSGILVLGWAWHRARTKRVWMGLLGGFLWLSSLAGAALLYVRWVPGDAYETDVPFEIFGRLAVDVATLGVPSGYFSWPRLLGVNPPGLRIWGIADTAPTNYLGYLLLGLVAVFFVFRWRRPMLPTPELVALGIGGAIALILSLGPTLKIGQVEPGLDASLLTLPTAWLYEHVPGLSEMRATNRWLIVTRFAIIGLAAAGLNSLWSHWAGIRWERRAAVVVLGLLALVEIAPNVWRIEAQREQSIAKVVYVRDGIVAEAKEVLVADELVLMLPSVNDFLANYLVPMAGVRSYNVGGDKNYGLSYASWPEDVRLARDNYGPDSAELLCNVLDGEADAIVLPFVDPYSGVLLRPPDPEADESRVWVAHQLARDARFTAQEGEWMVVLRSSGRPCTDIPSD